MTPTFPLPLAARLFSVAIAVKFRFSDEMLSLGTAPEEPPEPPELEPLLPQAANARPTLRAAEIVATVLVTPFKKTTSTVYKDPGIPGHGLAVTRPPGLPKP